MHPYDDERVICGQGTVALEMLAAVPGLEAIVVPVGGGGLISGVAVAAKDANPAIEIFGVETDGFPAMHCALHGKQAELRRQHDRRGHRGEGARRAHAARS